MENIQSNPERPAERLFRSLVGRKKPGPKSTKLIIDGKDYSYFHYTKCLFEKLKNLDLKSPFKKQSYALVCYLQILIHSPVEKRNLLFD